MSTSDYIDYTGDEDTDPVCAAILEHFNPPDDDASFESIMVDALEAAARYIESHPCICDRLHPDPHEDDNDGCERCQVLGRIRDKAVAR